MTKQILVGGVPIGGGAPVSVQSMTNTDTRDVEATVAQIERLTEAGCNIVRSSVYDLKCATALREIKSRIRIPIVADIHFDYRLAIAAMENGADKLRFNPGNIGDESRVKAVVHCARTHHTPIRIGVNAGSIEPALRQKYGGPTTEAMIESALKHVVILEREGFTDIVLSLKASNVRDTVDAYRAVSKRVDYPLHVGVTETGDVASGIIKSAAGIGALLLDGIGDTIRVSLTDDPVHEVETGLKILRAVGLLRDDIELVSCPTCGRTRVDVMKMVEAVNMRLPHKKGYLKIAVMGCAVNGPGEARDADIGVAFGDGNGILFEKGQQVYHGAADEVIERLIERANEMLLMQQK
ncbi:MAG: 4-hydroxy-3-methylbut-2-en-1-yl diphosphate synthase [Firmicutes bacterium HGW-Firmicutes-9]|jgi:(E)-4-hydroxy-3-methylbut-2-enyl-diphosphate synthase|nr:MAG: 4-hydroxy-3-methylbut-2-en-1-yl diphosphate synthase [Firmicutes bacterium HGW-Firmicutes-9]